ncbi:unnamed protein product [Periconia digitata]|uniref:Carboxylic ester hydrolase n=1 Tax=Periconia digitata TaxID=1303443 RepID=A0A9W4U2H5_9PLEO|nr:unnamed protein product [Periconia digitata]
MKPSAIFAQSTLLHLSSGSFSSFESQCADFSPSISNATVAVQEYIARGTNVTLIDNDKSCNRRFQIVDANFCRLALHVQTSERSSIVVEVWMPETWEAGRVLATGNGGVDGCIQYENLAYGNSHGFVTVGANNGHNGTSGAAFLNNSEVVIDFAHRSLHTSITLAKELSTQLYNQKYSKAYYIGCSLGGRQGIDAADRYPEDFDGVIAGSPASDFNNLYAWRAGFYTITGANTSSDFITSQKWIAIHDEVLRQCDRIDGVQDGILEDPSLCDFRPEVLLCDGATQNTTKCLTVSQLEIVKKIYSPLVDDNGDMLYPGMQPGSELRANTGLYAGNPWQPSVDWYRYVLLSDPSWDPATFNTAMAVLADTINPADIRTFPTSLAPFKAKEGKLIMYHGLQDQQITSFQSTRFYEHLARGMNATSSSLDEFYRFFKISGMFHCNSGPGAWTFGQGGGASAAGVGFERESNVLRAMVEWVEGGVPPETITGTKFVDDDADKGIFMEKKHCRYPLTNVYLGGNAGEAAAWECQMV